jgi:twitching motility protein PilJ
VQDGNAELRLPGTRDPVTREQLQQLLQQYEQTRTQAAAILGNLQGLVQAREAQAAIVADSEAAAPGWTAAAGPGRTAARWARTLAAGRALAAAAAGRAAAGLLRLFVQDQTRALARWPTCSA